MKIGIVGYQGSGKSTLYHWLTGVAPDPAKSHQLQSAMATIPEPRVEPLCAIYHPKKVTLAALELVDTPGLSRDQEGNPARLGLIREASSLIVVMHAYDQSNPVADLARFEEDLLLADLEIVSGRVDRLRDSLKKPRPHKEHEEEQAELEALLPIVETLEAGQHVHAVKLTEVQERAIRSFRLLTEKPRLVVFNVPDDEERPERFLDPLAGQARAATVPLRLELELSQMSAEERQAFIDEMGLKVTDRDSLVRTILDVSGQMLFFTAGEKEVRTWLIRQGGTALEAAAGIHTDLARGFIRAETMQVADLVRLGSEREIKAHNLVRNEPKDYVIQDGDIITIKFSV